MEDHQEERNRELESRVKRGIRAGARGLLVTLKGPGEQETESAAQTAPMQQPARRQTDAEHPAKVFEHKQRISRVLGTKAHLLAHTPHIISTRGPTDPPPSSTLCPSFSVRCHATSSMLPPEAAADFIWRDTAGGVDKPSPSPQRRECAKVDRFNSC
ncbi:hypothetical protein EYF80_036509 [Liparis tanakae]|uniref:Uncharacterized protein n=1 Tax=Liparis tanakae TaxID=230148 RepID=A0A4Z2GJ51_9TELE|nr:hypothetical protein EYF80_036509 [Liparis tanakae]